MSMKISPQRFSAGTIVGPSVNSITLPNANYVVTSFVCGIECTTIGAGASLQLAGQTVWRFTVGAAETRTTFQFDLQLYIPVFDADVVGVTADAGCTLHWALGGFAFSHEGG